MIDVLGALMGIDIQASTRPEGSTDIPEGVEVPPLNPGTSSPPPPKPTQPPAPAPAPAAGDVEMEDDDEEAQAKKAAEAAKESGLSDEPGRYRFLNVFFPYINSNPHFRSCLFREGRLQQVHRGLREGH